MTETKETKTFRGILESVNKAETGQGKPYLKIKACPDGLDKARTYNYHPPWIMQDDVEKATAHIEETRKGLLPQIDSEISFTFTETPNPGGDFPFKNIKEFTAEFKAAGKGKKSTGKGKKSTGDEGPAKGEQDEPTIPRASKMGYCGGERRTVILKVGLAKSINPCDYNNIRLDFQVEEAIEGDEAYIEKVKDAWLEKFRLSPYDSFLSPRADGTLEEDDGQGCCRSLHDCGVDEYEGPDRMGKI